MPAVEHLAVDAGRAAPVWGRPARSRLSSATPGKNFDLNAVYSDEA
jgi:hypothetical protein